MRRKESLEGITTQNTPPRDLYPLSCRGRIRYDPVNQRTRQDPWWAIVEIPRNIIIYYKWWLWREHRIKIVESAWKAHCTFLRGRVPPKPELWGKHNGRRVRVRYSPEIETNGTHYWLPAECQELCEIRTEMGLRPFPRVPLHITIGTAVY